MVVRRGVNDGEVAALARRFKGTGHIVRFIEYMDVGHSNGWRLEHVVPAAEVVAAVGAEMPLEAVPANYPGEVARRFRYRDGSGEIGVVGSVTLPFCGDCTRARLSADGKVFTCLFATAGHDLRALLRAGGHRRGDHRRPHRHLAGPHRPLLRDPLRRHRRPAQGGDVLHRGLSRFRLLAEAL